MTWVGEEDHMARWGISDRERVVFCLIKAEGDEHYAEKEEKFYPQSMEGS